jgi:hypothetical protein
MTHEERLTRLGITEDELDARVAASRARQGLPPTVEDEAALARMAALVVERPPRP